MKTVIAIDLGGTTLKAALIDEQGNSLKEYSEATAQGGRNSLCQQLATVVRRLQTDAGVVAVGIGSPGFVDSGQGKVILATNIYGWSQTDVRYELQQRTGLPVVVENDANAAALGEAWLGAGKSFNSFFMLTLGTGVGGAFYIRNKGLLLGENFKGGEVGHAILYPGGIPCRCGQAGCVEQYLAGPALKRFYLELGGTAARTPQEIFKEASMDKEPAVAAVEQFSFDMANLLISLTNVLDPEGFIVGGGLTGSQHLWLEQVQNLYESLSTHGETAALLPAALGNDAGLIGAASLALAMQNASNY